MDINDYYIKGIIRSYPMMTTSSKIGSQSSDRIWDQVYDQILNKMWSQIDHQLKDHLVNQMYIDILDDIS